MKYLLIFGFILTDSEGNTDGGSREYTVDCDPSDLTVSIADKKSLLRKSADKATSGEDATASISLTQVLPLG